MLVIKHDLLSDYHIGDSEINRFLGSQFLFVLSLGEFSEKGGYSGSEFVPTYEDTDGDWMLVGDVPWE